jgi:iron complex outermembrane recepter protein
VKAIYRLAMAGVSIGALVAPFQVLAQAAKPAAADADTKEDIVVTGTLIRNTQVVGSQTLTVDAAKITERAATSTNELLRAIPQIANQFNGRIEGDPRGVAGAGNSITRPNLRNIPSTGSSSGALTLLLVDGMRLTPVGVNQASLDPDVVPTAVLEGIDIVTDGGSSLYGADAVAGVMNFRSMLKFDGIKIDGNSAHGTTIGRHKAWDAALTVGTSWATGNAYISGGYSHRNLIQNFRAPWTSGLSYNAAGVGSFSGTQCEGPVGTQITYRYLAIPNVFTGWTNSPQAGGATTPIGNPCNDVATGTYLPEQKRANVFAAVSQQFGDNVDLRVTGYWVKRDTYINTFARGYTTPAQPAPVGAPGSPGAPASSPATILGGTGFSFLPNAAYRNEFQTVGFETWGISPELKVKLGSDWQLRVSAHYGRSTNSQSFPGVDSVKAQCYITGTSNGSAAACNGIAGGQLNPLNVAGASAAVINDILNFTSAQDTKHELFYARAVVDGTLFTLPDGDVKIAGGVEFQNNKAQSRINAGAFGSINAVPYASYSRNAKSAFAEVSIPVTSFATVNGSVRHDSYSDFGSTTNPSIGFNLTPTSWLKLFGHWNTSYNAPTAIDGFAFGTGRLVCGIYVAGSNVASQRPNDPLGRDTSRQGTCAMVLQGSRPGLKPQTAESWALGFQATPARNVKFGAQFYSIALKNTLGSVNPGDTSTYTTNPTFYTYNVTPAQYAAVLATLVNGGQLGAQQTSGNIALIVDTRTTNLNAARLEGVDFNMAVSWDLDSVNKLTLGLDGTRQTRAQLSTNGLLTNELGRGSPKLSAIASLALSGGPFTARVAVNYSGSFTDNATNYLGVAEEVNPFTTTDLSVGYSFRDAAGPLSGLSVRLNVDNAFEATPQTVRRLNTNNTSYNNWTLGRVVKLGASFKF